MGTVAAETTSIGVRAASRAWRVCTVFGALCIGAAIHLFTSLPDAAGDEVARWQFIWLVGVVVLGISPRFPWLGPVVFIAIMTTVPRYPADKSALGAFDTMMTIGAPTWVAGLSVAGWAGAVIAGAARPRRAAGTTWVMLVFIAWLGVCLAAALWRGVAWDPHVKHHPVTFVHALAMFFVASQTLRSRGAAVAVAAAFTVAVLAQWTLRSGRIEGDGDISAMSVLAMPLAVLGALVCRRAGAKRTFIFIAVSLVALLAMTENRNGAVAFVVLLVTLWFFAPRKLPALAAAAPVLIVLGVLFVNSDYFQRFKALFEQTTEANSADQRLANWQAGWRMALDHPVLGVGTGNYHRFVGGYETADAVTLRDANRGRKLDIGGDAAHNSFVNALGDAGFPGAVLYVTLFGGTLIVLRRTWRRADERGADDRGADDWRAPAARMLFATIIVYLAVGMFISRYDMAAAYLLAGWAAGLSPSAPRKDVSPDYSQTNWTG